VIFAYTSCFANNGQSFGGLSANSPFYNVTTLLAMGFGRFLLAVPALAFAGVYARQKVRPTHAGTLPTDDATFGVVVIATALLVVGLSFFAALALGPIVEQAQMARGFLNR
jgi:K+-transporting ATPase ATPase A chain